MSLIICSCILDMSSIPCMPVADDWLLWPAVAAPGAVQIKLTFTHEKSPRYRRRVTLFVCDKPALEKMVHH